MNLKSTLFSKTYTFSSVKEVLAKASERKSGDQLAGICAESKLERVAAKDVLSRLTVAELRNNPVIPYEQDAVTRIIQDDLDMAVYDEVKNLCLGELRERLLAADGAEMLRLGTGLTSEVIAGLAKLMGNLDLMYAGGKMRITATCNTTIGGEGIFASRLQPNHPVDSPKGVAASVFEGLSYGVGDAVLGLNPAVDTVESTVNIWNVLAEIRDTFRIPTQTCVLSHVTTQLKALHTGAKADLCFQSIAGSQKGLESFGVSVELLEEAYRAFRSDGSAGGENVMYFETGQGSELSSDSHNGADQGTLENRCYGLARHFRPFLVNTVVGFMGPEYLYDSAQLLRAGLEDVFCGHLHGLPMGCDCCYTNHMPTDQNDLENLMVLLASAGCHYVMGVPQGDDVMLMYQSSGYHDVAAVRELLHRRPIPEFESWLAERDIWVDGHPSRAFGDASAFVKKVSR